MSDSIFAGIGWMCLRVLDWVHLSERTSKHTNGVWSMKNERRVFGMYIIDEEKNCVQPDLRSI